MHKRRGRHSEPNAVIATIGGKRLSVRRLQERVDFYAKKCALKLTAHTLRHAYATHMLHRGARLEDIQALLGHASPRMTQRYAHASLEYLKSAYAGAHPRALKLQAQCRSARCDEPQEARTRRTRRATVAHCMAESWWPDAATCPEQLMRGLS